ncbi:MAG: AMP-binding protein [Candidatus Competibacteraceae bacterium]|nr:AMP-binding protein [Candidatus Competibacteraceae bacterium]
MTVPAVSTPSAEQTAALLLETITALVREARQGRVGLISLDSHLERDIGLDSLSRAELLLRLERDFAIELPQTALITETPRELLRLLLTADGNSGPATEADLVIQPLGETESDPSQAGTLLDVLDWHVRAHPQRVYLYLYGKSDRPEEISYAALHEGARAVAVGLQGRGLLPGQTVAIMLPTGQDYFLSFFGTLLAGGIPVPIYPPTRPSQLEEHLRRHSKILDNAQTPVLITVPEAQAVARLLQTQLDTLRHIATVEELTVAGDNAWARPLVRTQDIAFLQYTSGSTGDPKGVMLSHANLLANIRAMGQRIQASSNDVFVSWLPLYHDMGLIGACLGSLYYAFPLVVMSPLSFLARPARWLRAIHRHHGTLSAAPNFAYELCLRNIPDKALEGLDLSSWRLAINGAEPVNPGTLERFIHRFEPYGFRPEAMAPVYGLAESSVGLALHPPARGVIIDHIERDAFMKTGLAVPAGDDNPRALCFAACGQPLAEHQIRVVDEQGRELPERQEGRLEFQGPSATSGYYRNPEATRRLFRGDWLDSGDRAYLAGGDVYITGRVKEMIIRGGRNIFPYELESAVGDIAGIRRGNVAVFASDDPASGTERLVVVAETRTTEMDAQQQLRERIQSVGVDLLGLPPDEVVLVPPHTVLKTSSGKIRRATMRELFERKALGQGRRSVRWQAIRLAAVSIWPPLRRSLRKLGEFLYAGYAWVLLGVAALPLWLGVMVLPNRDQRWALARTIARLVSRLAGIRLGIHGLTHLAGNQPCLLVSNHASYLDSLVLAAVLPGRFSYVAKRELRDNLWVRLPLERLDTVFVERFDLQQSVAEGERVTQAVQQGRSLVFFPEGTFRRMPGLQPFRMGAFVVAAQTAVPVVPVTIRGTRSLLRAHSWFPRRGSVQVVIGEPIAPTGQDWQAAVQLRDAARAVILHHCGEPDLG